MAGTCGFSSAREVALFAQLLLDKSEDLGSGTGKLASWATPLSHPGLIRQMLGYS